MKELLIDTMVFEVTPTMLKEAKNQHGRFLVNGVLQRANAKNQNGRVYPKDEIVTAVESIGKRLHGGETVLGELDHPTELQINLDRVSHMISEMRVEGSNGYGKLKILDTPMGKIAEALLKGGAKLGVSSRGSGNVNESGRVSDFDIVTVDIVAQPSAPDAYPKAIYESLFNMKGGAVIHEMAEAVTHDKKAEIHLARMMESFIRELELK